MRYVEDNNPGEFEMTISISMREMLEAGVHFGHRTRYWNPQMRQYIFGARQKLHIINLQYSLPMFRDALEFVAKIAENRGRVLFVGTKHAAREIIKEEAIRSGMPYVNHRWLGGMLTNYKTIRQSIKRLKDLEAQFSMENIDHLYGQDVNSVFGFHGKHMRDYFMKKYVLRSSIGEW